MGGENDGSGRDESEVEEGGRWFEECFPSHVSAKPGWHQFGGGKASVTESGGADGVNRSGARSRRVGTVDGRRDDRRADEVGGEQVRLEAASDHSIQMISLCYL